MSREAYVADLESALDTLEKTFGKETFDAIEDFRTKVNSLEAQRRALSHEGALPNSRLESDVL